MILPVVAPRRSSSWRVSSAALAVGVVVLLVASIGPAVSFAAPSGQPTRMLALTSLPSQLPTNSSGRSTFPALVVSITDLKGNILVASNDTVVYLSSSQSAVLSVDPQVTILAGQQYAIADVSTTATPGSSVVTAVAPGFESASTTFQTSIARGYPTGLRIYPLPSSFPTGVQSQASYGVSVIDAAGLPARTIQSTNVNLATSDTSILTVGNAQIPVNQTLGYFSVTVNGVAGTAEITASAPGLVSDSLLVTVTPANGTAVNLLLSTPSVALPADGRTYKALTVSLTDNSSKTVTTSTGVQIFITSSRTDIATTPTVVTIPAGQSFASIPVTTFAASGSTIITAAATNFVSTSVAVSTVSIPPTQLGIYLADSHALVSRSADALDMVVQLQDSTGAPAEARASANVIISFSNSSLMSSPVTLTIAKGSDLVYASVPIQGGTSGTFTAISNGLASASAKFSATPLHVSLNLGAASQIVTQGQRTPLYLSVLLQGAPVSGASLTWSSSMGSLSQSATTTDANGASTVDFVSASIGTATITVVVTAPAIGTYNATLPIVVTAPPEKQAPSLTSQLLSFPYILIIVGAAAAVAVVVFLLVRRRRKRAAEAEGAISEESGFSYFRTRPSLGPVVR